MESLGLSGRELLGKSLATTLAELVPSQEFHLYKVLAVEPKIEIALLTLIHKGVVISDPMPGNYKIPSQLSPAISEVVGTADVIQVDDEEALVQHLVYPVYDRHNDVYAVLETRGSETRESGLES
ncbi:MAG: hypothetical protein GY792_27110 [Gammaproteobacteria bacterium]|nr:hypothetical protein [Gammaproteobacteria bacterium]